MACTDIVGGRSAGQSHGFLQLLSGFGQPVQAAISLTQADQIDGHLSARAKLSPQIDSQGQLPDSLISLPEI